MINKSIHGIPNSKGFTSIKTINKGPSTTKTIYEFEPIKYYDPE